MGQQFRIQRTIAQVPVVAASFQTIDLPRSFDFEAIHLRLNGTVNVTTSGVAVRAEAPTQAVARVEIIADGRNTLYSAPFWHSVFGGYDRAQNQQGARYVTPPSGFAIASYAVEACGVIDLNTPDGERPKDSNFRTNALQLFQLKFTFGNVMDMFTGGVGTFTNMNIEVSTEELVELPAADGTVTTPSTLKKVSYQETTLPSSNVNFEQRLPAGNLIKSIMLRTEGLAAAGEPTTGVINNAQALSGVDVRLNMSGGALRAKNNNDFGYIQPGYYIMDFTRNGSFTARLSELWDVTRQAEPKAVLNVVGGANVKIQAVVTEYLGLR